MLLVNSLKYLWNFIPSLSLLTGHFSGRVTSAFSLTLSCSKSLQSNNIRSTDWSPSSQVHFDLLHKRTLTFFTSALWSSSQVHFRLSIIMYLYRHVLILPCPVTIAVKLGVAFILAFDLSEIFFLGGGIVIAPSEEFSHSFCHWFTLCSFKSHNIALCDSGIALVDGRWQCVCVCVCVCGEVKAFGGNVFNWTS